MNPQVVLHTNDYPPGNLSHARPVLCIHSEFVTHVGRAGTQLELWDVLDWNGGFIQRY